MGDPPGDTGLQKGRETIDGRQDLQQRDLPPFGEDPPQRFAVFRLGLRRTDVKGAVFPKVHRWIVSRQHPPIRLLVLLIELYGERCEAHGRTPTAVAIRRDVHVGADAADAERVAGPVVAGGYRGFDPSACTYGSAEQVTEKLGAYAAMGYTDVIVRHLAEDQNEVLESFARLAGVREALYAA